MAGLRAVAAERFEQLAVGLDAVAGAERHLLGHHQLRGGEVLEPIAADQPHRRAGDRHDGGKRRAPGVGGQECDRLTVGGHDRIPLDARAGGQRDRGCGGDRHLEEMAAGDIAAIGSGIRVVDDERAIGRERHLLDHERPRRQQQRPGAGPGTSE